jgi:hypothetical protein
VGGNAQRRRQAEKKTAQKRDRDGEGQDAPIEPDLVGPRQVARPQRQERADAHGRQRDAQRAAAETEQRAFGKALADEPPTPRAQRHPHSQFAFARHGARQHEARHVSAGNRQNQGHRAEKQPQRGLDALHVGAKRLHPEAAALVGGWVLFGEAAPQQRELRLSLGQCRSGTKPAEPPDRMCMAILQVRRGVLPQRCIHVAFAIELEAAGRDAHNGVTLAIQDQRGADCGATPGEVALP